MRSILLVSCFTPEISKELIKMLPKPIAEIKLAFIGTASDVEEDKTYLQNDKEMFAEMGFAEIVDVDLKNKEDLEKLDSCDVIFVEGGNTFYLLKWIRQSGFDQKLKTLLADGKIYVGVSAGSEVLGTSIETAGVGPTADKNDGYIEDTRGLRQVPFMIAVHMNNREKFYFDQFARKMALRPIIGIEDGQAIVCEGDRYHVIGPGKPLTWNSKLFR